MRQPRHRRVFDSDTSLVMACHVCGKRFATWKERNNHKARQHGIGKPAPKGSPSKEKFRPTALQSHQYSTGCGRNGKSECGHCATLRAQEARGGLPTYEEADHALKAHKAGTLHVKGEECMRCFKLWRQKKRAKFDEEWRREREGTNEK